MELIYILGGAILYTLIGLFFDRLCYNLWEVEMDCTLIVLWPVGIVALILFGIYTATIKLADVISDRIKKEK